ncbi:hypothetical protein [Streptomyces sp. DW26H14]|uniref:hypothetical protein n=1 Tax=Streptomyces sp. DW26H14 TaxID=3435395 RepID=UPI00403E3164
MLRLAAWHVPLPLLVLAALPYLRGLILLSGLLAAVRGTRGPTRAMLFNAFAAALSQPPRRP